MKNVSMLALSKFKIDGGTQSRKELSESVVNEYSALMMEGSAQFPAVIVFHDGSDYWLADGFHRYHAARKATITGILADIRIGTREDAIWFSIGANKENGTRPTRGDIKHAVELALMTWPDKTQESIAEQVGCARSYVTKIKDQLVTSDELKANDTVTGKDGKTYPTNKAKPIKAEPQPAAEVKDEADIKTEIKQENPQEKQESRERAFRISESAIGKLKELTPDNEYRGEALDSVLRWIKFNR